MITSLLVNFDDTSGEDPGYGTMINLETYLLTWKHYSELRNIAMNVQTQIIGWGCKATLALLIKVDGHLYECLGHFYFPS